MPRVTRRLVTRSWTVLVSAVLAVGVTGPAWAILPPGIDTSHYQHAPSLNWRSVRADGVTFAFLKATEGQTWTDPYFSSDWQATREVGIYRGAYHFARPSIGSAAAQARHFAEVIGPQTGSGTLPPVLDLETTGGLNQSQLIDWTRTFLETLERLTGRVPMVYVSPAFWEANLGNSTSFHRYPLWIAHYGVSSPRIPGGWPTWTFWQTTSSGAVEGISGRVDKDVFNGDLAQLRRLADAGPEATAMTLSTSSEAPMIGERFRLTGTLRTSDGLPVADGSVAISVTPAGAGSDGETVRNVVTDGFGRFATRVRARTAASYTARYAGEAQYDASDATTAVTLTPRETQLTLDTAPETLLAGRSLGLTGTLTPARRLAGHAVTVEFRSRRKDPWTSVAEATTDKSGAWNAETPATQSGSWRVRFDGGEAYQGSVSPRLHVAVELNPTRLTLEARRGQVYRDHRVTLTGAVTSGSSPVPAREVTISTLGADGQTGPSPVTVTTDDEGRFRARVRLTDAATLEASTGTTALYQAATSLPVSVTLAPPEATTLRPTPRSERDTTQSPGEARTFTGHLVDSAGQAVAGRRVRLWRREAGSGEWVRLRSARTDGSGAWELHIKPRRTAVYRIVFRGGDRYAGSHSSRVRVTVGAGRHRWSTLSEPQPMSRQAGDRIDRLSPARRPELQVKMVSGHVAGGSDQSDDRLMGDA